VIFLIFKIRKIRILNLWLQAAWCRS